MKAIGRRLWKCDCQNTSLDEWQVNDGKCARKLIHKMTTFSSSVYTPKLDGRLGLQPVNRAKKTDGLQLANYSMGKVEVTATPLIRTRQQFVICLTDKAIGRTLLPDSECCHYRSWYNTQWGKVWSHWWRRKRSPHNGRLPVYLHSPVVGFLAWHIGASRQTITVIITGVIIAQANLIFGPSEGISRAWHICLTSVTF